MRLGLNEHESARKPKTIALTSKGKSSKALKANESEEESPDGRYDEDSVVVGKMAMLSNKVQYLARKNKMFLSRSSGYKCNNPIFARIILIIYYVCLYVLICD